MHRRATKGLASVFLLICQWKLELFLKEMHWKHPPSVSMPRLPVFKNIREPFSFISSPLLRLIVCILLFQFPWQKILPHEVTCSQMRRLLIFWWINYQPCNFKILICYQPMNKLKRIKRIEYIKPNCFPTPSKRSINTHWYKIWMYVPTVDFCLF